MELPVLVSPQPTARPPVDTMGLVEAARRVGESPQFEEWVREVEEYRRQNNTVPEAC